MTTATKMTDAERTMREEQWLITNELFDSDRPEPPDVAAFRTLQEKDWEYFMLQVTDNDAMKFFNPEQRIFFGAADWEQLCENFLGRPFNKDWAIPQSLPQDMQDLCRAIRALVRARGGEGLGGCVAFHDPREVSFTAVGSSCALVVIHAGGSLAPYFNPSYEDMEAYSAIDNQLTPLKLWREGVNGEVTAIYRS